MRDNDKIKGERVTMLDELVFESEFGMLKVRRLAEQQGHEGLTEGASIDQLASAWADAEATW